MMKRFDSAEILLILVCASLARGPSTAFAGSGRSADLSRSTGSSSRASSPMREEEVEKIPPPTSRVSNPSSGNAGPKDLDPQAGRTARAGGITAVSGAISLGSLFLLGHLAASNVDHASARNNDDALTAEPIPSRPLQSGSDGPWTVFGSQYAPGTPSVEMTSSSAIRFHDPSDTVGSVFEVVGGREMRQGDGSAAQDSGDTSGSHLGPVIFFSTSPFLSIDLDQDVAAPDPEPTNVCTQLPITAAHRENVQAIRSRVEAELQRACGERSGGQCQFAPTRVAGKVEKDPNTGRGMLVCHWLAPAIWSPSPRQPVLADRREKDGGSPAVASVPVAAAGPRGLQ